MTKRDGHVLTALLLLAGCAGPGAAPAPRPNIVFIVSDDQGWTDFGFMGSKDVETPHLDRLARESLLFRRAYVPSSLCCPSLAALLTGKYPHQTRVTGNEPEIPAGVDPKTRYRDPRFLALVDEMNGFMAQHHPLPGELAKAGYVSFEAGKWWAGNFSTGGFTEGMSHGDQSKGGRHGDEGLKIGRQTMQPVFDFIDRAAGKPFFVWYAPMMPHDPHTPPERLLEKYRAKTPSIHVARYRAMCEWFDETCGQLLGYLDQKGLRGNTMVVFLVDNGWIQDPDKPGFRADSKKSQYDMGLRTPLMIRWPGRVAPRADDTPVSTVDVAPTIHRALGLAAPERLPGVDLLDGKAIRGRDAIFGACFLHSAVDFRTPSKNLTYRWCVKGEWKLIVPEAANVKEPNKPGRGTGVELYNLTADPFEETNLAAAEAGRVGELAARLDAWWKP
jgi:uncharacterized sulfatase